MPYFPYLFIQRWPGYNISSKGFYQNPFSHCHILYLQLNILHYGDHYIINNLLTCTLHVSTNCNIAALYHEFSHNIIFLVVHSTMLYIIVMSNFMNKNLRHLQADISNLSTNYCFMFHISCNSNSDIQI